MQRFLTLGVCLAALAASGCGVSVAPAAEPTATKSVLSDQSLVQASKALPIYAELVGQTQGNMDTELNVTGHVGRIQVYALTDQVAIPKSAITGLPTGKRVHGPLTLVKAIDRSTPKIRQAVSSGEQLSTATFRFYRLGPNGAEENYYTIRLQNAIITSVKGYSEGTAWSALVNRASDLEEVQITFEKITWTFEPDGVEAEDTWMAPR